MIVETYGAVARHIVAVRQTVRAVHAKCIAMNALTNKF